MYKIHCTWAVNSVLIRSMLFYNKNKQIQKAHSEVIKKKKAFSRLSGSDVCEVMIGWCWLVMVVNNCKGKRCTLRLGDKGSDWLELHIAGIGQGGEHL